MLLKFSRWRLFVCALGLGVLSLTAAAQDDTTETSSPEQPIVFIPPASGAPGDLFGAGTRDATTTDIGLSLLVPESGGLTATAQPVLIWFVAQAVEGRMIIEIEPVAGLGRGIAKIREGAIQTGFHALDLGQLNVDLTKGQLYQWRVELIEGNGTAPLASGVGLIEHREINPAPQNVREAASAGLWYDALSGVFETDRTGGASLSSTQGFLSLARSAGLDLTNIELEAD
jgi:hypothetical protein